MGRKKIIIDTNNLISALGWKGKSRDLFLRVTRNEFDLFISIKQLDEIKRVLEYPKFGLTEKQKNSFISILLGIASIIETKEEINVVRDFKDNMLIEAALESNAEYIITGDNDLLSIKEYKGVKIIKVSDFLDIVIN